jgi:diguanylate cyclase
MTTSLYLMIWLLPSILLSIGIGAHVRYGFALRRHGSQISQERERTLQALLAIVQSAEELTNEVGTHNHELQSVERSVYDLSAHGEYEAIKVALLKQIASVMESNRSLEHDLVCTRYRLEEVAQELDRTRLEARIDTLSGVGNRKAFDESLRFMFSRFKRCKATFALLLIDVDHFKWINDTHGHPSGDAVVTRLGETLREAVRGGDYVARYGGDEFGLLLSGVDEAVAQNVATRIRKKVETTNFDVGIDDARVAVTLSMGLAVCQACDTPDSLMKKADAALYRSKQAGRNRLTVYQSDLSWGSVVLPSTDDDSPVDVRNQPSLV